MKKFELGEGTAKIVRYLSQLDKGDKVNYKQLSQVIGKLVNAKTHSLVYARKILERDHNAVWTCIPNLGIVRLNDSEIADRQRSWFLRGARNKLTNGAKQADVVEIGLLDIEQLSRFSVDQIMCHLAVDALSRTTQKRIDKVARGTSNDLPAFNAVEWMITLSPRRSGGGHKASA